MRATSKQIIPIICLLISFQATLVLGDEQVRFNRDIRPILSDKCFQCHGPDSATRQAGLRLDEEAGLKSTLISGDSAASEMVDRSRTATLN